MADHWSADDDGGGAFARPCRQLAARDFIQRHMRHTPGRQLSEVILQEMKGGSHGMQFGGRYRHPILHA
jgi:hypothetical protein